MNDPSTVESGKRPAEPSLTTKVVRGASWMFAGKFAAHGLAMIKLIVLARLLSPEDFGLFGFMMLATMALETLTRTGFGEALIQFEDETADHLDTAWTLHVIRGFILAGAILIIAPAAAWFFDEPRLIPLLQAFCIAPILIGFENIGIVYFRKELHFHKQITFNLCADTLAMVVGIALAFILRNVWALVGATLTACVARVALSYALHSYRPRFSMRRESVRRLFSFGVWLTGSSILLFLALKGDRIILGHVLGAVALGVFGMAHQIASMSAGQLVDLLNNVMMPAYAKAQQARERLRRAFLGVLELILTLLLPITAFVWVAAPEIVLGVFGENWRDVIAPLRILALVALASALDNITTPLFIGTGRTRMAFVKSLIRGGVTLALAYPLTARFGVVGTAWAGLIGTLALTPAFVVALRHTDTPTASALKAAGPGWLLTLCVLSGTAAARVVPVVRPLASLALMCAFALLLSLPAAWILYRAKDAGPFRLLREGLAAVNIRRPVWTES